MSNPTTTAHLYESSIGRTVEALQDAGRNVYFFGFSPDGYALVIDRDREVATVAHLDTTGSLGRYECSPAHVSHYAGLYTERFPIR